MSFLLDTDICSAHLKGDRRIWQKIVQHGGQLHVSTITVGELYTWALRKNVSVKRRDALVDFLRENVVLDVTTAVAEQFGVLRSALLDAGQGTPELDLLIASTAMVHNLTLVTHNVADFANLPGLTVQDWLAN